MELITSPRIALAVPRPLKLTLRATIFWFHPQRYSEREASEPGRVAPVGPKARSSRSKFCRVRIADRLADVSQNLVRGTDRAAGRPLDAPRKRGG